MADVAAIEDLAIVPGAVRVVQDQGADSLAFRRAADAADDRMQPPEAFGDGDLLDRLRITLPQNIL
jgi:hypothetical protein